MDHSLLYDNIKSQIIKETSSDNTLIEPAPNTSLKDIVWRPQDIGRLDTYTPRISESESKYSTALWYGIGPSNDPLNFVMGGSKDDKKEYVKSFVLHTA